MTTELVELADRLDAECSRRIMQSNPSSADYYDPADPRRILMTEAATAIRALASRAGGWLPVDSAPKDGTAILAFWKPLEGWPYADDGSNYAVAQFRDHEWRPAGNDDDTEWDTPYCWQPLPEPPAAHEPVAEGSALAPGCGDEVGS